MSWDVLLLNAASVQEPNGSAEEVHPLGSAESVRALISDAHPDVDWTDPAWGILEEDGWSIEFNMGSGQTINSIMLHVRGTGDPLPAIAALCTKTGWAALDTSDDEYLDVRKPSRQGWKAFQAFRDELRSIAEADPTVLRRSKLKLEDSVLVRSRERHPEERYALAALSEVRLERGTNWASVILALLSLGIAVLLKVAIPYAWLGWLSAVLFAVLGLLFAVTARPQILVLETPEGRVVILLVDTPDDVRAFHSNLMAAYTSSQAGPLLHASRRDIRPAPIE